MANLILFISGLTISYIHLWFYNAVHPRDIILITTMMLGCSTTILNHAITSDFIKSLDRGMMIIGFICDLHLILTICNPTQYSICILTLFSSVISYFTAKHMNNVIFHINAHLLLTLTHIILMCASTRSIYM